MSKLIDLKIDKERGIAIMTFYQFTFDQQFIRAINDELDQLEKVEGPLCLITTCANQKIYSAGLNFQVFKQYYEDVHNFIAEYCRLLGRFMRLGFPTIACINGHCLAGGFMFAMAHDLRIINSNKKVKLGMTEINLGMTIPEAMIAPLEAKMNQVALRQICLFGETVSPQQCFKMKVVDQLINKDELLEQCKIIAERLSILGENKVAYSGIKQTLYGKYIKKAEGALPDPISKKLITYLSTKL